MSLQRYDRSRFLAFGVLPVLNIVGLLLYGLNLATSGAGGAEDAIPALLVMAALCLLLAMLAAIRRGHDVGWSAWLTVPVFWVSLSMGPVLLVLIGYLMFAKSSDKAEEYGPIVAPANLITWIQAVMNLVWPWAALAVLARLSL
jgi:uncharacterized membrane protein YhaH (DUF805 family)